MNQQNYKLYAIQWRKELSTIYEQGINNGGRANKVWHGNSDQLGLKRLSFIFLFLRRLLFETLKSFTNNKKNGSKISNFGWVYHPK